MAGRYKNQYFPMGGTTYSGSGQIYLPPFLRSSSALAFSISSGCSMVRTEASTNASAARSVPFVPRAEQDWAVFCQE